MANLGNTWIAVMRSDETSPGKNSRVFPFFSSIIRPIMLLGDAESSSKRKGLVQQTQNYNWNEDFQDS